MPECTFDSRDAEVSLDHMHNAETSSGRAFAGKTALVVDSAPDFTTEVLAALPGWKIQCVADNFAALESVRQRAFDLVITGEKTSGKDDVDLLRRIRTVRPHTRLIIVTNESTPLDVIDAMRDGAFSYFSTPFLPGSFAEMVRLAAEEPCWDDGIELLSSTPEWVRLMARCEKKTSDRLLQFFHEMVDLPVSERDKVGAAFHELLMNAIEHGGRFDPTQYVEISYVRARHAVICRIKDPGQGFSVDDVEHAAIANPPDNPLRHQSYREAKGLRPGGFGILLTRHLVDEVLYDQKGNGVLLIKYLAPQDLLEESA